MKNGLLLVVASLAWAGAMMAPALAMPPKASVSARSSQAEDVEMDAGSDSDEAEDGLDEQPGDGAAAPADPTAALEAWFLAHPDEPIPTAAEQAALAAATGQTAQQIQAWFVNRLAQMFGIALPGPGLDGAGAGAAGADWNEPT